MNDPWVNDLGRIDQALRCERTDRVPVAPVITAKRELFESTVMNNASNLAKLDGFLLHPRVFDSGWIFVPSKPGMPEPVPIIKSIDEYDDISDLGPVEYGIKTHLEKGLVTDLKQRVKESPEAIRKFVEKTDGAGMAFYCGAMGITPMGYITYYRGVNEALKDMGKDLDKFLGASMDIATLYPDFLSEFAKAAGVNRVWISFAYATPTVVGNYYFERLVWKPAKTMLKALISKGIMPILQFDDKIDDFKFLKELPAKSFIVHLPPEADLFKAQEALKGFACIAGNLKLPTDDAEAGRTRQIADRLKAEGSKEGFVISTDGGSPFILTEHNANELKLLDWFM